ncbi:MAG: hypothetical protein JRI68_18200 [Deltaproteobacteria bacterium]|nr:hypothetical protein [Deltaproteobacteria bacterium]
MARSSPRGLGYRGGFILLVIALVVVGWLYASRRDVVEPVVTASVEPSVVAAIPDGAMLMVVVDVPALRKTELGKRLLGHGRDIAGLGEIQTICGADPMDAVTQLAVAVPTVGLDAGFGVFAQGTFNAERLLSCAERIVARRGGKPVRRRSGRFAILRDANLALASAELAVADGGPFVLAEPPYLAASLGAMARPGPPDGPNAAHRTLRRLVPDGMVVATVVLSEELRRTLVDELRKQGMADSPFRAVNSGALGIRVGQALHLEAVIRCDDAQSCLGVVHAIDTARREEAYTPFAKATALARVLDTMVVRARDTNVVVRVSVPLDEALGILRNLLLLRRLGSLPSTPPDDAAPSASGADGGVPVEATAPVQPPDGTRALSPAPSAPAPSAPAPSAPAPSAPPPPMPTAPAPTAPVPTSPPPEPTSSTRSVFEYR